MPLQANRDGRNRGITDRNQAVLVRGQAYVQPDVYVRTTHRLEPKGCFPTAVFDIAQIEKLCRRSAHGGRKLARNQCVTRGLVVTREFERRAVLQKADV